MKNDQPQNESTKRLKAFYEGLKVCVTGGASFIGSHLVELLIDHGAKVAIADDFSSGSKDHIKHLLPGLKIHEGDLRNEAFAKNALDGYDVVFHLAAQHGGRGYIETHPVECVNNMLLDHIVYAAATRGGAKKIIFASSACVYPTNLQASSSSRLLLKEDDANFDIPGNAFADGEYGWAKLMGELQLRAFCKQHHIDGVACRIFTAYGERENESHAVVALIAKSLARLDPFPIWGDGLQTRNFTYVKDTAMGLALSGAVLRGFETINVGSSTHHTILELLEVIFTHVNWRPENLKKELDKPVGVLSRAADNDKCLKYLGWEPKHSLAYGVARTIDWYAKNSNPGRRQRLNELLLERA